MASPTPLALFSADDLTDWLGFPVDPGKAVLVEKVVWGWLRPVLNVTNRPATADERLFAWALELGGIAHENPASLSAKSFGDVSEQFSVERRDQLLGEIRAQLAADAGARPPRTPRGNFPPAQSYPDPASGRRCAPRW